MAKQQTVISHWYQFVENFHTSPMAFYQALDLAIKKREVPELEGSRVDFHESGVLSARREYLRVARGKLTFDICGAPFGTGFFFSWWLTEMPPSYGLLYLIGFLFAIIIVLGLAFAMSFIFGFLFTVFGLPLSLWFLGNNIRQGGWGIEDTVLAIPIIGPIYERLFQPPTYYKIDTALMYQEAVHNAVMEVVDQLTTAKGLRALSELERKPVLKKFAQSA